MWFWKIPFKVDFLKFQKKKKLSRSNWYYLCDITVKFKTVLTFKNQVRLNSKSRAKGDIFYFLEVPIIPKTFSMFDFLRGKKLLKRDQGPI